MLESIFVIADSNTNIGFQLAGVRTLSINKSKSIENQIENLVNKSDIGLIIIDDYLYSDISDSFKNKLEFIKKPIIISIPLKNSFNNRKKTQIAKNYVKDLITYSSGIHIRLD